MELLLATGSEPLLDPFSLVDVPALKAAIDAKEVVVVRVVAREGSGSSGAQEGDEYEDDYEDEAFEEDEEAI